MPRFVPLLLLAALLAAPSVHAQRATEGPALGLARAAAARAAGARGEAPSAAALARTAPAREAALADGRVALELVADASVSPDALAAALRRAGADVQSRHGRWLTALADPADLGRIARVPGLRGLDLSRRVALADDHAAAVTGAFALRSGLLGAGAYTGAGTLVCVIDTGLDWTHRDFRDPSDPTKTRVAAVWDQTLALTPGDVRPAGFTYGVAYTQAQIDDELDGTPTGTVRMRDLSGHGTHVTGTAVGNGASLTPAQHVGMAPGAGLVVVKTTYTSAAVADALTYCANVGTATGRPVVANLSLAADFGPHDGTDLYNAAATAFGASPGRVAVLAAGNGGGTDAHIGGGIPAAGSAAHTLTVPAYTAAPGLGNDRLDLDLWIDNATPVTIEITTPGGAVVSQAAGGEIETTTPSGTVYLFNGIDAANGDRRIFVVLYDATATTPTPGAWTLRLVNPSGAAVGYDGWFYDRTIGSPGAAASITGSNTGKTLGNTATGAVIAGSWTHRWRWTGSDGSTTTYGATDRSGEVSDFSGRGPTRDGRVLPTLVAPGQGVISSRSSSTAPPAAALVAGGFHVVSSGTSFSTPGAAGAVALLLQQDATLTGTAAAALLAATAHADAFTGAVPNATYGAGKLDVYTAMARLVDAGGTATLATVAFDGAPTTTASASAGGGALALRFTSPLVDGGRVRGVSLQTGSAAQGLALSAPLSLELWTDDGGAPGTRIAAADLVAVAAVQANSWTYAALTNAAADLAPGTPYWLVAAPTGGTLVLLGEATAVSGNSFTLAAAPPIAQGNTSRAATAGPFVATAAGSDLSIRPVLTSSAAALPVELTALSAQSDGADARVAGRTVYELVLARRTTPGGTSRRARRRMRARSSRGARRASWRGGGRRARRTRTPTASWASRPAATPSACARPTSTAARPPRRSSR